MNKPKFFFVTTIPRSLVFFLGQYQILSERFDITAISSQKEELELFGEKNGVKVHCIPMEREISLLKDAKGLFKFIQFFRRERPTIVHGNTPKGSLLSMLAAKITRVPVRIYMCHGLRYQGCTGFKRKLLMTMERISCHCATDVVCVSKGVAEVLLSDHISKKQPVVIWNGSVRGIDTGKFNPNRPFDSTAKRKQYGIEDTDYVLTFIGRIVRDKGIQELVDAFQELSERHKDMKLLLVGRVEQDNAISDETKKIIDDNPAIIAPGVQYDVPDILAITHIFVFPSYREGFGLSLMEAGAMEVPSISTNITGCNEVVEEGKTGLLIPTHSSKAIVDSVERLYKDKELYNEMKMNCRNSIVSRYEQQELFAKYRDFYYKKAGLLEN